MSVKKAADLKTTINSELADNNAGLISAYDIRHNLVDIVDSIVPIVASGDFQTYPFDNGYVVFNDYPVIKSGVKFDTADTSSYSEADKVQTIPYPGASGIDHNVLNNVSVGDVHTQYLARSGVRMMTGNLGLGLEWINNSGEATALNNDNHGLRFEMTNPSLGKYGEIMHVGSGNAGGQDGTYTTIKFDLDKSTMFTGKSVAQAWISFNGVSGQMAVNSSYNISALEASGDGTYKIYFKNGIFSDGNYVALAHSNGTSDNNGAHDMDLVNAAVVVRTADYLTLAVRNDNGEYVDAKVNDVIVFGNTSGVIGDTGVTLIPKTFN